MTLSFRQLAWLPFHMGRHFLLPNAGIIQAFQRFNDSTIQQFNNSTIQRFNSSSPEENQKPKAENLRASA